MEILRRFTEFHKLCRPGIKMPVGIMILTAIFVLSIQGSSLFSAKDLIRNLRKKPSPSTTHLGPSPSIDSATENYSAAVPISAPVADSRSSPAPQPPKTINTNGSFLSPGYSPLGDGAEAHKREKVETKSPAQPPQMIDTNGSFLSPGYSPLGDGVEARKREKVETKSPAQPPEMINTNGSILSPGDSPHGDGPEAIKREKVDTKSPAQPPQMIDTNGSILSPGVSPLGDGPEAIKREKVDTKSPARIDKTERRNCSRVWDSRKRRRTPQPLMSIGDMVEILLKNQRSSCSRVPRWSSPIDQEILQARRKILNAPIVEADPELYPPAYRNFSTFKRSYELMEKILKVYVYKEGEKPIFHQPFFGGIYAAEGWFMKHMEGGNRFLVGDPKKAHLFYMPFSTTNLRFQLFDSKYRHKRNLIEFLQAYVANISSSYPFWKRTGGADHFSVSCHDWASMLTARTMGNSIRALCNGDLNGVFELGKDVSIPLTAVRNSRNPAQNAGGRPGKKRDILAFFAGQMHGYVRPLLYQHWGDNADPDIQVFGPLRQGRRWNKTIYTDSMRRTKYCLCPRGYEANSPRLAEAFFFECVPVIISDNFVPPFFEVLNWEAFSVVVPVKNIPRLKEILLSIPREKYLALQLGVKKVQRHFLWHPKPKRYDLFHTILHSVWFNRVLQLRVR